jgi:alpha-glucosidase
MKTINLSLVTAAFLVGLPLAKAQSVSSPDNAIQANVSVVSGRLTYSISYKGSPAIEASPLGTTVNSVDLGQGVTIGTTTTYSANTSFPWRGTHATAINHYNGRRYPVTHSGGTTYTLDVRVFDDGVAFSYLIAGSGSRTVNGEATAFKIPAGSTVWYQPAFDKYEGSYTTKDIATVAVGAVSGPPLTIRLPGTLGYAAITEGALVNYSGMHLQCNAARTFQAVLSDASFSLSGAIQSPWRVIMIGDLDSLVNCDIPAAISAAPDTALFPNGMNTAWIKPGRSTWSWLNATRSITLANMKTYESRASQLGIENNIVDDGWKAWTNKFTQMAELCAYGNSLNPQVKTWVWVNYADITNQATRRTFFSDCHTAGVVGIKIDFMDAETKARVDFEQAALRDAVDFQLMIDFHGVGKPTGEARTFPNEMTREAVRGKEGRPGAGHSVMIPFTRGLAGSTDYTPMDLDGSWQNHGTVANEIASAICITSALLVFSEDPTTMVNHPFVSLVRNIPATWDETIVLPQSSIGQVASFARRKGTRWFVAVMNNATARNLTIDFVFLPVGKTYSAKIINDSSTTFQQSTVSASSSFSVSLAANGGFVAELNEVAGGDTYQAENYPISGTGTTYESTNTGFNGTGYVNFGAMGGTLTFNNINGNGGGAKTISFRYANGSATVRTGQLVVNGTTTNITFGPTGSWTTWLTQDATVTLANNTTNTISLQSNGQDLANVDQLTVP